MSPTFAASDVIATNTPCPASSIAGRHSFVTSIGPVKLTATSAHQSSSVVSTKSAECDSPPLKTTASMRPNRSCSSATPDRIDAASAMSRPTATAGRSSTCSDRARLTARSRDT